MSCSKCGGPRDRGSEQRYCRACHAAYARAKRPAYSELSHRARWKANARAYLKVYLRRGKITRGPCEVCGTTVDVHAHHDDYSKPLDVRWLCPEHHREHHYWESFNPKPEDCVYVIPAAT